MESMAMKYQTITPVVRIHCWGKPVYTFCRAQAWPVCLATLANSMGHSMMDLSAEI